MPLAALVYIAIVAAGIALIARWVMRLNTSRTGFSIFAMYPTMAAAQDAAAFLRHHGIRAELEDRRLNQFNQGQVGSVHVLVPAVDVKRADQALRARARGTAPRPSPQPRN